MSHNKISDHQGNGASPTQQASPIEESALDLPTEENPFKAPPDKTSPDWLRKIKELIKSAEKIPLSVIIPLMGFGFTVFWNYKTDLDSAAQYRQGLVKDYVESIKGLLLDDFHKTGSLPEIKVEEIQAFVKSKTAATLKAVNAESLDQGQTTILINFLQEAGIGFISKYDENQQANKNQDVCIGDGINFKKSPKVINFSHFLCGIDLREANLNQANLPSLILEKADLSEAQLEEANLFTADLEKANLNKANLKGAKLINANLREATLISTNLENADLTNANLAGAFMNTRIKEPPTNLRNVQLLGANLINIKLIGADLQDAFLTPSIIKREKEEDMVRPVNLRNADLTSANLGNTNLSKSNLRGAILSNALINGNTSFDSVIYDQYTCFPSSINSPMGKIPVDLTLNSKDDSKFTLLFIPSNINLKKKICNLKQYRTLAFQPDLKGADLRGADLRDADLSNADMQGTNLKGADLRNANLRGSHLNSFTQLNNAIYNEATILPFTGKDQDQEAKHRGMWKIITPIKGKLAVKDLKRVNLSEQDLTATNLSGYDLQNANLSGQDLTATDLSGSDLQNANLSNILYDRWTKFEGAIYDQDTKLPFSKAEAKNRKMIYKPHPDLSPTSNGQDNISKRENGSVNWQEKKLEEADFSLTDLTKAHLERTNLIKANLSRAILSEAHLNEADLTNANLRRVNLNGAILTNATLIGADLRWATLNKAKFEGADFTCADLRWAHLEEVKPGMLKYLKGANLKGVILKGTNPNKVNQIEKEAKERQEIISSLQDSFKPSDCKDNKDK